MSLEDRLRKALSGRRDDAGPGRDCPAPDTLAAFVSGDRRDPVLRHLASCASCREDVLAATTERKATLRAPGRRTPAAPWIAAAAAALFALALGAALLMGRRPPEPVVVAPTPPPRPAPRPEPPDPPPLPPSEPIKPLPEPRREEKPAPKPVPRPEPEKPAIAAPDPAPEPPKPAPKPAPEPTRARIRGTFLALAGGSSTQTEGESAWQSARTREFTGLVKLRADSTGAKVRIGTALYYLRGGTELSVSLDETTTTARLSKGEAFFDVTPGPETFLVEAASSKVTVKGTRFLVTGTDVLVQRGTVEYACAGRTVSVQAGERSAEARAPEKADPARRLGWMRALDETLVIEAEAMVLQQGMTILPEASAAGGRAVGLKAHPAPNTEPSAELRAKRKQPTPYAVWIRLQWSHHVAPAFTVQVHDAARWTAQDVVSKPGWQWVRVGTYELPSDPFTVRVVDPQGGMRLDQLLLTSDLDLTP